MPELGINIRMRRKFVPAKISSLGGPSLCDNFSTLGLSAFSAFSAGAGEADWPPTTQTIAQKTTNRASAATTDLMLAQRPGWRLETSAFAICFGALDAFVLETIITLLRFCAQLRERSKDAP